MAKTKPIGAKRRTWAIDTSIGGFGDVWMRLHALYALAGIRSDEQFTVRVPPPLQEVAQTVFGERLHFETKPNRLALAFTHLGLRHLAKDVIRGRRFVNPFHRSNLPTQRSRWIEIINRLAFSGLAATGRVYLNQAEAAETYGGWMQISDLPPARGVSWQTAVAQFRVDFPKLRLRLQQAAPPKEPPNGPVVFPSGTGFQIMPATLAGGLLPAPLFAFHESDPYQEDFRAAGLRLIMFSDVAGLLKIASNASRAVCTDSFPSHILQTYSSSTVIALSHFPRNRMVHPAFDGIVLDSTAPCCPCLTRARTGTNVCPAGRPFCLTWDDPVYLEQLRQAITATSAPDRR